MKKVAAKQFRSAARELAYIAVSVALITVCAQISLPIGPVPFTLQTLAVALTGALLGWKRGICAVLVYVLMGLCGIPVFAGFRAQEALFGATGGYIFGFVFEALCPALVKLAPVQRRWGRAALFYGGMIAGLAACYFFGTVWFVLLSKSTVSAAFAVCVLPFLLPDFVKLLAAALLAVRLEKHIR